MSDNLFEHALHHDWPEVEAEVSDCRFVPAIRGSRGSVGEAAYYAVGFRYKVKGTTYHGALSSPVEVQARDKFSLRYNPERPEENNSLLSECERGWFRDYTYIFGVLLFGFIIFDIVRSLFFRR